MRVQPEDDEFASGFFEEKPRRETKLKRSNNLNEQTPSAK